MKHQAKKSFGQHFLKSEKVLRAIVQAAEIKKGENVLEIGPGTGALTRVLVEAGAEVMAVEADRDLVPALEEQFSDTITLIEGDALKFVPKEHGLKAGQYKLVANLPYNIGTELIERFFISEAPPSRFVVMLQKEVGERMLAEPGDMSVLSVATQLYTKAKRVTRVPRGAFDPPPNVESVVLLLEYQPKVKNPEDVIAFAKQGFRARRKQLHRNLSDAKRASSEVVKKALEKRGLSSKARAQELSVEDWIELSKI